MNAATLQREPTPAEGLLNLWCLGAPPEWLQGLAPAIVVERADGLPSDASVVLLSTSLDRSAGLLGALRRRCPKARLVVITGGAGVADEASLLEQGALAVLPRANARLGRARLRALIDALHGGQSDQTQKRHQALSLASHLLSTLHDESETFQRLVDIVARELHSSRVSLMQVNREAGLLAMRAAVGIPPEVVREATCRIGEGIAGTCAAKGKPVFVDDHSELRSGDGDLAEYTQGGERFQNLPMSLTVPVLVKGEVVGVVNVTDRIDEEPYTREDIDFIQALMGHAGYLLENAALMTHLRALKAFSDRVVNTIAHPLVVIDGQARIVHGNERFASAFDEAESSGLGGRSFWQVVDPGEEGRAALDALLAGEIPPAEALEGWGVQERVYDVRATPFEHGADAHFLVFMHDVTARRAMERRLVSAEKMASLGVLAAGTAHEINNPLGFVKSNTRNSKEYFEDLLGLLDLYREGDLQGAKEEEEELDLPVFREDIEQMVKETIEGVARVETIVAGLKSFAHPDTQTPQTVSLGALLDNALLLTQGKWRYSLQVEKDYADAPEITALPSQLEQVFMNLVMNAAQASPGMAALKLSVESAPEWVRVHVADTCGGIPEAVVDKIFEPFFTTKDIGEGTGLGLAISYNIIEAHGGRIWVDSTAGEGSTFHVELPRGRSNEPVVVKQQSRFRI